MARPVQRRESIAVVPFEASALIGTLVCEDPRDRVVAMLLDFSTIGVTYVMPWRELGCMFKLTSFDDALHKRVGRLEKVTPVAVQETVRSLHLLGFAGEALQAKEMERQADDHRRQIRVAAALAKRLLLSIGIPMGAIAQCVVTRKELAAICSIRGLRPELILKRLQYLAMAIRSVGLPHGDERFTAGPLRILTKQLGRFAGQLRSIPNMRQILSEDSKHYEAVTDAATTAHKVALELIDRVDTRIEHFLPTLTAWTECRGEIASATSELSTVLDGWSLVTRLYNQTPSQSPLSRWSDLAALVRSLPGQPNHLNKAALAVAGAYPDVGESRWSSYPRHVKGESRNFRYIRVDGYTPRALQLPFFRLWESTTQPDNAQARLCRTARGAACGVSIA